MTKLQMFRSAAVSLALLAGVSGLASRAAAADVTLDLGNVAVAQDQGSTTTQHAVSAAIAVGSNEGSTNSSTAVTGLNMSTATDNVQQVTAPVTTSTGNFQEAANGSETDNGAVAGSEAAQAANSASGATNDSYGVNYGGDNASNYAEAADMAENASFNGNWQTGGSFGQSASGAYSYQAPVISVAAANVGVNQLITSTVDQTDLSIAGSGGLTSGANNTTTAAALANESTVNVSVHQ